MEMFYVRDVIEVIIIYVFCSISCKIYSVKPDTIEKVEQLKKWKTTDELDFFEGIHLNQPARLMVLAEAVGSFQQQLEEHQIENRVLLDNVEE
jgi:hypothetical protein